MSFTKRRVQSFAVEEKGDFSLSIHRAADDTMINSIYYGPLNRDVPLMWAPDSSHFYFTINNTVHAAAPEAAGYYPVIPTALEPYLSPDGSMLM